MIEVISLLSTLFIFFLFSIFPLQIQFSGERIFKYEKNFYDILFLNILINIIILLFISFTKIDLFYYFICFIFCAFFSNIFFIIKSKNFLRRYFNISFIFFILFNIIIFFDLTQDPTLSWDGQKNWFYKAQSFFYGYNFFDLNEMEGVNYYPHLGTLLWGFFWKNSFLQYEYIGRFFYVFIYLLSIFSICDQINKKEHVRILVLTAIILVSYDNFLFKGYQETLIFSLLVFASKNFYKYITKQNNIFLIVSFICINLVPWVKNEGYLFLIIFNASLLFMIKSFHKKQQIILFIVFSAILLIIKNYLFYKFLGINLFHGGNLDLLISFSDFSQYLLSVSLGFVVAILKYKIWIFILIGFYILSKIKKIQIKDIIMINFLKINLFLYFCLILGIYFSVINHIYGINWWIDNSLDRIIYQISGFFIIYIIIAINNIKNKF